MYLSILHFYFRSIFVWVYVVRNKSKITIKNLNSTKRPISAVAENLEVTNAKNIIIKTNQKIKFNLLYDQNRSLQKKIKIEQLRREIK
jgi:NAD+ kinase